MRVLLCSPYNAGPQDEHGGIAVWADNIMEYYRTLETDIQVCIIPYNRKRRNRGGRLMRIWGAIADYHTAIEETYRQIISGIDVIHLCSSASISLIKDFLILKKAKRAGKKTVLHLHFGRIPLLAIKRNWEWCLLHIVLRWADDVITMDKQSYNVLQDSCSCNVHYLPNPLSRSIIAQVEQDSHLVQRINRKLTFVGHVIPSKGVFEMVEACRDLNDIKLHVFGKVGDDVRKRMETIAECGNWLVFEGEVKHERVIHELLSTDVFLLPSYTEGFPNVILESMACGCAIVSTRVGAIPEMLEIESQEPCGLCCEPRDADALKSLIQYFLDNPVRSLEYRERAVKRVNLVYAVQNIWKQLNGIWRGSSYLKDC